MLHELDPLQILELGNTGNLKDLAGLLKLQKSDDKYIKDSATKAVAKIIFRTLRDNLDELNDQVRNTLVQLMMKLDSDLLDVLKQDILSLDSENKLKSLHLLAEFGNDETVINILKEYLKDDDEKVRATVASVLKKIIKDTNLNILIQLLNDKDNRVRANAVESIEQLNNKNTIGILIRLKKDKNNRVRANVLKALWNLGHKDIFGNLEDMIKSKDENMRSSGAWLIGKIGKTDASLIKMLSPLLKDPAENVKINVIKAFINIGGEAAKKILLSFYSQDEIESAAYS